MKIDHINYQIINKLNKEVGVCLDSLDTFLEDMEKGNYKSAYINEFFQILNRKKNWLSEMLNQIEFLYGYSESKNLTSTQFVLNELIEKVAGDLNTILTEKDLYLRIYSGGTIRLESNKYAIAALLRNLISIAIERTETGGISIDYRIKNHKGLCLIVEISDTGNGIPIDTTGSGNNGGILVHDSLRIKLLKYFIHLLDGQFSCRGQLGKGCNYQVILPISKNVNSYTTKILNAPNSYSNERDELN